MARARDDRDVDPRRSKCCRCIGKDSVAGHQHQTVEPFLDAFASQNIQQGKVRAVWTRPYNESTASPSKTGCNRSNVAGADHHLFCAAEGGSIRDR